MTSEHGHMPRENRRDPSDHHIALCMLYGYEVFEVVPGLWKAKSKTYTTERYNTPQMACAVLLDCMQNIEGNNK